MDRAAPLPRTTGRYTLLHPDRGTRAAAVRQTKKGCPFGHPRCNTGHVIALKQAITNTQLDRLALPAALVIHIIDVA